jgi:hypothetical protein
MDTTTTTNDVDDDDNNNNNNNNSIFIYVLNSTDKSQLKELTRIQN